MRLLVHAFQPGPINDWGDGTWLAIARPESAPISQAGIAEGSTERSAVQGAINAYYTRLDAVRPAVVTVNNTFDAPSRSAVVPSDREFLRPALRVSWNRNVAVDVPSIRTMLQEAIASDPTPKLAMIYEDRDGNRTSRDIYPSELQNKRGGLGFGQEYLVAVDCDKDEPRTFRLDRIEQLERVA